MDNFNLDRFIEAQERDYSTALVEIKSGRKQSHWIWYIFPQIQGLGHSETAQYYSIRNADEARAYLENEYLRSNLIEICRELIKLETNDPLEVMGFPDNLKLLSSMTLFHLVSPVEPVFKQVLDKYYDGKLDENTVKILNITNSKNKKSSNGIIGLAVGDALGVPAEFKSREELRRYPIVDMIGDGTYNVPARNLV